VLSGVYPHDVLYLIESLCATVALYYECAAHVGTGVPGTDVQRASHAWLVQHVPVQLVVQCASPARLIQQCVRDRLLGLGTLHVVLVLWLLVVLNIHFQMFPIPTAKVAWSLLALFLDLTTVAVLKEKTLLPSSSHTILYHLCMIAFASARPRKMTGQCM
jgi:hypothetical protein